jgi:hypothetical protein
MSVFEPGVTSEEFRGHWGIPMGRPGGAVDYAQCIFGLITVSSSGASRAHVRTNTLLEQSSSLTVDGCWKRVSGYLIDDR